MPLIATRGAASAQGFGEFAQSRPPIYIDDVFSTWLYTGNGSTQTINNGIDLAGKGGLVWLKARSGGPNSGADNNLLFDTARGANNYIRTNGTDAQNWAGSTSQLSFTNSGFSVSATGLNGVNTNATNQVSWTFREEPKFFDVVTYTGNGVAGRQIAHNLGSVPGCIIVKKTNNLGGWVTYHRSIGNTQYLYLDTTSAAASGAFWNNTTPTSTVFTVSGSNEVNASGDTYVAYLFAHDAGGFGATGNDNVISCGSFGITSGVDTVVNLGYEPQWLLIKKSSAASDWRLIDNMRGMTVSASALDDANLFPNTSGAESLGNILSPAATGFIVPQTSTIFDVGSTYIYIAIRRPMKPPTSGTQVFTPITRTGTGSAVTITSASPSVVDLVFTEPRVNASGDPRTVWDRLRGAANYLATTNTGAEANFTSGLSSFAVMNGYSYGSGDTLVNSAQTYVDYAFRRAPGFFDEVCYTGNNLSGRTVAHNLTVAPELMIVKQRSGTGNWSVYAAPRGATEVSYLNNTFGFFGDAGAWANTAPTASVFTVGANGDVNNSGSTFVAYLFASLPGISQVGSYTGNGSSQTINCGFAAGARFVMIKRTDSTGNWFVWDSARGINPAGTNDPYLLLNSTAAEVTNNDSLSSQSVGFGVIQNATTNINVNAATYIFLAIA